MNNKLYFNDNGKLKNKNQFCIWKKNNYTLSMK